MVAETAALLYGLCLLAAYRRIQMELKDFTEKEKEQINAGLSTAEISDQETADKILALVPEGWIKKIPFFVRKHATTKTIERIAAQYPELYAAAKKPGEIGSPKSLGE